MASMSHSSKIIIIDPCAESSLLTSGINSGMKFNPERWVEACIDWLAGEQQDQHPPSLEQVTLC